MSSRRSPIPLGPEELMPEWLSTALGVVSGFVVEPMPEGVGFIGRVVRLHLTYPVPGAGPPTAIAKVAAPDAAARARTAAMVLREARFYDEVAPQHGALLGAPAAYHAAADPDRGAIALLRRRSSTASAPARRRSRARSASGSPATCHASGWSSPARRRPCSTATAAATTSSSRTPWPSQAFGWSTGRR